MDVSSLGNANFANRQNVESTSGRGDNDKGTAETLSPLRDGADDSTSTLVPPPDATQGSAQEDTTVRTNDLGSGQNNAPGTAQTGGQNTGGQVDLTV